MGFHSFNNERKKEREVEKKGRGDVMEGESAGNGTQGLSHARQVLYPRGAATAPTVAQPGIRVLPTGRGQTQ